MWAETEIISCNKKLNQFMKNLKILSSFACCKRTIGHKHHGSVQFMKAKSNDQDQSDWPVLLLGFDMTCMSLHLCSTPCFFQWRPWCQVPQVSWKLATGTPKLTMKRPSSVASPAGFKPRTYLEGSAFHCWEMFSDAKRIQNCSVENLSPRSVFQRLRA